MSITHGQPRVLVTDGGERAALAAVRGLAAAGYRVIAAAYGRPSVSHWSRACSERIVVGDPRNDSTAFIADLKSYLMRHPGAFILPATDFSLRAISQAREELAGVARLPLPSANAVEASLDRQALARAAGRAGFAPVPTALATDLGSARAAAKSLGPRMIVKSLATTEQRGARITSGRPTRRLDGTSELNQLALGEFPVLIQRAVSGQTISLGGVVASGRLLAAAASKYTRMWPPEAGNASFSTTIPIPVGLPDAAEQLLAELGWEGLFELELIRRDDGLLCAIDLNPRPYGSMALAIAAGANLPAVWCDWLSGRNRGFVEARPGMSYRWSQGDVRHLLKLSREGRLGPALRGLIPRRHVVHPHLSATDPLPSLARAIWLGQSKLRPS